MGWWKESIDIVKKNDPAARTSLEVLLTYPGLKALAAHRISHFLVNFGDFGLRLRFILGLRLLKVSLLITVLALSLVKQLWLKKELCSITVLL